MAGAPGGPCLPWLRAGNDARRWLKPLGIAGLDTDYSVEREAAPMPHWRISAAASGREQAPPLEQAKYPLSHGALYSRDVLLTERCRFAKPHTFSLGTERHNRRSETEVAGQSRERFSTSLPHSSVCCNNIWWAFVLVPANRVRRYQNTLTILRNA